MHDTRLRLQHLYDNPISISPYHYNTNSNKSTNKTTSQNLNLHTKHIEISPDYDLPLKQLQYTKTRKYKQNLNPIFEQLQTTQDRYAYSKQWQSGDNYESGNKYYERGIKNDNLPISDRYFIKKARKEEKSKLNELKERSRILSEDVRKGKKGTALEIDRGKQSNKRMQIMQPQKDSNYQVQEILQQNFNQELTQQQRATHYIQQLLTKTSRTRQNIKQTSSKLQLLTNKLEMHKQKSLIKQRQLFYLQQQKQSILIKGKQFQESLKEWSQKYTESEVKHNEVSKELRMKKKELKKEEGWLREENQDIKRIQLKIQQVLRFIREAEQEDEKRGRFLTQFTQEKQLNQQLNTQLQSLQAHFEQLSEQSSLLQQQTTTLSQHLQQLLTLQQKFRHQTSSLLQNIQQLNQQITQKHQFISQQQQFNQLIKQVELEMGQMSGRKILLEQEIQDVNAKISLKRRNISYIRGKQQQKGKMELREQERRENPYENMRADPYEAMRETTSNDERPHHASQISFNQLSNNNFPNPYLKKSTIPIPRLSNPNPLPTIRQQSNTTSAYQSPKLPSQQNDLQSQSLQLDSRMASQTQILQPHESPKKQKKYFVIESEDDNLSSGKLSFYFQQHNSNQIEQQQRRNSQESQPDHNYLKSEEIFVQRQKKPSIQHRLYQMDSSVLRTQHQHQHNYNKNPKAFSAQLQSPNNNLYHPSRRQQSQQSQYHPNPHPPKLNNKSKEKQHQKQHSSFNNFSKSKPSHMSSKLQSISPRSMSSSLQQEFFQSLIDQYQQIKSNSCFEESWKHRI